VTKLPCRKHAASREPCSCGLGRMSRLVEPLVLSLLAREEARYGYEIIELANQRPLTDSEVDAAVVYRTLRTLEEAGCVESEWEEGARGPARHTYRITDVGRQHLLDWRDVLERHTKALQGFLATCTPDSPRVDGCASTTAPTACGTQTGVQGG
jgi:PadR family transcriptional regulator, regulatory protein PadR